MLGHKRGEEHQETLGEQKHRLQSLACDQSPGAEIKHFLEQPALYSHLLEVRRGGSRR